MPICINEEVIGFYSEDLKKREATTFKLFSTWTCCRDFKELDIDRLTVVSTVVLRLYHTILIC